MATVGPRGGGLAARSPDLCRRCPVSDGGLLDSHRDQGLSGGSGSGRPRRPVRAIARRRSALVTDPHGHFGNTASVRARRRGPGHDPPDRSWHRATARALS
ncbi:hypothetical protein FNH04_20815 [Streptomyces phyllanthi]|uniref:Uncharacterized protein n=1 Tax=Streptomyces phyllanthi TaxID=1803180 RepID=A0A5N8W4L4_9ACTN|nr:hypothetical protein [Streptomyces phyllanthi]